MEEITGWLLDNKKWLFSGVGVAVVTVVAALFFKRRSHRLSQQIRSGRNSTNVQVGGDANINSESKRDDAEE